MSSKTLANPSLHQGGLLMLGSLKPPTLHHCLHKQGLALSKEDFGHAALFYQHQVNLHGYQGVLPMLWQYLHQSNLHGYQVVLHILWHKSPSTNKTSIKEPKVVGILQVSPDEDALAALETSSHTSQHLPINLSQPERIYWLI